MGATVTIMSLLPTRFKDPHLLSPKLQAPQPTCCSESRGRKCLLRADCETPFFTGILSLQWSLSLILKLKKKGKKKKKACFRTSLVAQWLKIHLPVQGSWVRALVWEDPTCCGATKPICHNYWARMPQLLKPARLEPVLCNKRSRRNEKPVHCNQE